ncbi:type IV secretion system protein [Glaciimonas sp. CA11.2]|uniref:type IV secretion system protein n=1 Tax=unclassified Glaciimonas TaxID=2644401 RepID=UPI002AB4B10C|nr:MULTISPECIES: type IV secretion system protein [unclassified Glaciimonas]MDY7549204.1 type IV secretion system protein [Glaciimonas sp. CA11.2]MEB0013936.1 type IV secretion system protein [Glaciimonas sp. Cout2]MEB0083133.1 type IV secretion system protein [Glaciimonas sp. Gout2]MEB0161525.1 type IV secretion system protein [Glaciimonas sp. CA11.2]
MKKFLLLIAMGWFLSAATPAIAQIPTTDILTQAQLLNQLNQMQQQYETMKNQYAAVTGSYQRGAIGLNDTIRSSSVVPGSWQEVVSQQNSGAFGASQNGYEKLLKTMPQELFQDPRGQGATSYKLSTDSVRAAMTGGDMLYAQVQTNLNNLSTMAGQVDSTANTKDAADLQNRIATENGMLQTAMAKLNVMNMNLQANMLNQQNQATANDQQRYKRVAP